MNLIDRDGMTELLRRSKAIGAETSEMTGEEMVLWRTDDGEEFRTTYEDAAQYGGYTKRTLRADHWRVKCCVPHAWGIWPPGWDLEGSPLLMFPTQAQAFRAASDRADFSAIPPVAQEDWNTEFMLPGEGQ